VDTAQEFNSVLETLQLSHSGAYGYLSAIDPSLWTVHANVGKLALFGWRTTNFVESENSAALSKRKLAPFNFFLTAMEDHMTALYNNKLKYKKWKEMKLLVTPFAQEKLDGERDQLGFYDVMPTSTNVAYVWDSRHPPPKKRKVFLNEKRCSCNFIDQYRMPCRHMLAALNYFGRLQEMYEFFDPRYTIESYGKAFEDAMPIEIPLVEELDTDGSVVPPLKIPRKGRPRTKRIKSRGEGIGGESRKCSLCATRGHNRRRCPNVM